MMKSLRNPNSSSVIVTLAAVAVLSLWASPARASVIGISSALAIADFGHIDWATYGGEFDAVTNGTTKAVPGLPGVNLTISELAGFDFLRVTQGVSWNGNFGDGDPLLYTTGGGPIDFVFNSPISAFGDQIQSVVFGAFTARIEAFSAANTSLGFFLQNGNSNDAGDDSAIFIGLVSTARDISRIRLSLTAAPLDPFTSAPTLGDFAVGNPTVAAMPEPATLVFVGTGLLAMLRRRNRRRVPQS